MNTDIQLKFTPKQGRCLALIYYYAKMHGRPPAEAEIQAYFGTSPPAVHQMLLTLERKGLIARVPGQSRSIKLLISPADIPDLDTGMLTGRSAAHDYPHLAAWISDHSSFIEIGYDYNTRTFARALDEGGLVWSGGNPSDTLDKLLEALDAGIAQWLG